MKELIEALNIFLKYGDPSHPFHCEHDYLYVDIPYSEVSEEDRKRLHELGFFEDKEYGDGGFGSFKYGSC